MMDNSRETNPPSVPENGELVEDLDKVESGTPGSRGPAKGNGDR